MEYRVNSAIQVRTALSAPIAALLVVMALLVGVLVMLGIVEVGVAALVGAALCAIALLVLRVSVTVTSDQVVISYGIGIIQRVFDIHALVRIEVVPNRSLSALHNPTAENALYIVDRSGRAAYVPLFEPRQLLGYLRSKGH
ncbi:MAG: hypothetical protein EBZ48_02385 [Proteobacteria bacterium]|nr:hypothetical protein [Pseudomonadota bacterium]